MATILLTGVTGAVGSSLAPLLKERGHKLICLVRGREPVARLQKTLGNADGIVIFNGDVTLPNLGVCESEAKSWRSKIDKVFHCASSIKFDEATKKSVYALQTAKAEKSGKSNCSHCAIGHDANKSKIWKFAEMDADHVTAWSKGGKTAAKNCEMLCKTHNRAKGNR